ncbi:hypothetical protein BJY01DRAFT_89726 [Aspergillus pseudoustus]|uniref:Uncharacterized protein n=1 Tax=Aspergillus pseudoustus TaxID=1810923 RepID=A0ABR4J4G3_9EURO
MSSSSSLQPPSSPHPPIRPPSFTSYSPQSHSPLFTTLPPELRHQIFTYALSSSEDDDPARAYSRETYWTRPGQAAPRKIHTALLRTCKLAYTEAWFMPFALAEHVFYLTASERAPGLGGLTPVEFEKFLGVIHAVHSNSQSQAEPGNGDSESERDAEREKESTESIIETGPIRLFAQLYILEPGDALQELFDIKHFAPKSVTLTLRYTDFWHWENNQRLYIAAKWVNKVRFPSSVTRFTMDFESIERRKQEVDLLVEQAVEQWRFVRKDGGILRASKGDVSVSRWSGSSMFGGKRWVRDEDPRRPGVLDYYVVSVTWKLDRSSLEVPNPDQVVHEDVPTIRILSDFVQISPPFTAWLTSLTENEMRMAGVGMDVPAEEAAEAVRAFRASSMAARARSRSIGRGLRIGSIMRRAARGGGDLI